MTEGSAVMWPIMSLVVIFLMPFAMWWLWRRMKKVQRQASELASKPERYNVIATEESLGSSGNLNFGRSNSFDDDLAQAERLGQVADPQKDLEGRR